MEIDLTDALKLQAESNAAAELARKKYELAKTEAEELAQAIKTIQKYAIKPSLKVLTTEQTSKGSVEVAQLLNVKIKGAPTKTMREQILDGFKPSEPMTITEVVTMLGLNKAKYPSVNTTLHAMVRQAKLEKVSPGKYRKI
jgi:hypothetical protein